MTDRRAIWKGALSFGLVTIPVKLYTAHRPQRFSFNWLSPCCQAPAKQSWRCSACGAEVERAQLLKGYRLTENTFVVIDPKELEALRLESVKTIGIEGFVPDEVDPLLCSGHYYIGPGEGGEQAYALLAEVLRLTNRAGFGRLTIHGKEHLVLVRARGKHLVLTLLYYPAEVLRPPELPEVQVSERQRELAKELVKRLEGKLELDRYRNRYHEAVQELIKAKLEGKELKPIEVKETCLETLERALEQSLKQRLKAVAEESA